MYAGHLLGRSGQLRHARRLSIRYSEVPSLPWITASRCHGHSRLRNATHTRRNTLHARLHRSRIPPTVKAVAMLSYTGRIVLALPRVFDM